MKKVRHLLISTIVLWASASSFPARACGLSFHLGLPFISFGIGLGIGAEYAWPAYGWGCAYPGCAFARPAYACRPTACYYPPTAPIDDPVPRVAPAAYWVPSTPGSGHWVPDPEPYRYSPTASTPGAASGQTVSVTAPLGGVRVYHIERAR